MESFDIAKHNMGVLSVKEQEVFDPPITFTRSTIYYENVIEKKNIFLNPIRLSIQYYTFYKV